MVSRKRLEPGGGQSYYRGMGIEHVIAFNLALLAAIISPGPAMLVAIRTTLSAGRNAGIAVGAGLGFMASVWTLMALLGLDAVFRLFPWAYGIAKTLGAGYLLYIAYRMWKDARNPVDARVRPARHAFREGVLINLLNPKSVLFATAVLVVVLPAGMSAFDNALIVLNHLFVEVAFYALLAMAMSSDRVSARYLSARPTIDRAASFVLAALGIRLLTSRL